MMKSLMSTREYKLARHPPGLPKEKTCSIKTTRPKLTRVKLLVRAVYQTEKELLLGNLRITCK